MHEDKFFALLVENFNSTFEPLRQGLENAERFSQLVAALGWQAPPDTYDITAIQHRFTDILKAFEDIQTLLDHALRAKAPTAMALSAQILTELQSIVTMLRGLSGPGSEPLPFPFDSSEFWSEFPGAHLHDLLVRYLKDYLPSVFAPLLLLGIVTEDFVDVGEASGRKNYLLGLTQEPF